MAEKRSISFTTGYEVVIGNFTVIVSIGRVEVTNNYTDDSRRFLDRFIL
jgi:hypothetical protein